MRHLKTYKEINEADVAYIGSTHYSRDFNGVMLECEYRSEITKPDLVEMWVTIRPTVFEVARMGIWSEEYAESQEGGIIIYYNAKVFENESDFEEFGISSVRQLSPDDVIDIFRVDMQTKMKWSYTKEELLDTIKKSDNRGDWLIPSEKTSKGYKMLTGLGGI